MEKPFVPNGATLESMIRNAEAKFAAEQAELNARVVVRAHGQEYTLNDMHHYFDMVRRKDNWKLPVDAVVLLPTARDVYGVYEAVIWFTGSIPTLAVYSFTPEGIEYHVLAAGYYSAVGA